SSFQSEGDNREKIAARISGGRLEIGASALRRDFKARVCSSDGFISSSIACRRLSRDSASMKVNARSGGGCTSLWSPVYVDLFLSSRRSVTRFVIKSFGSSFHARDSASNLGA